MKERNPAHPSLQQAPLCLWPGLYRPFLNNVPLLLIFDVWFWMAADVLKCKVGISILPSHFLLCPLPVEFHYKIWCHSIQCLHFDDTEPCNELWLCFYCSWSSLMPLYGPCVFISHLYPPPHHLAADTYLGLIVRQAQTEAPDISSFKPHNSPLRWVVRFTLNSHSER